MSLVTRTSLFSILMPFAPLAVASGQIPPLNIRGILWDIIVIVGVAVILGIVDYFVRIAPFIGSPMKAFIHWAIVVIACLLIIYLILGFIGL